MTQQTAVGIGEYLYAVIAAPQEDRNYGAIGINGGMVYAVSNGEVAAVVSDVPNEKIRPERRNLAAHHEVLKQLMKQYAVLPMSFGVIADGPEAIQRILSLNRSVFLDQLRRVERKVEMGLRVVWDVPNIFEYFVGTYPELMALRDRLFGGNHEPSQDDKL